MASLYIKDKDVAARVDRVARTLGTTKTEAVSRALTALEANLEKGASVRPNLAERTATYRSAHPLPPKVRESDKSFFDRLWGEPEG